VQRFLDRRVRPLKSRDTEKCTGPGAMNKGEPSHHHSLSSKTKQRYQSMRSATLERKPASAALSGERLSAATFWQHLS
jgi:hypothetical protein